MRDRCNSAREVADLSGAEENGVRLNTTTDAAGFDKLFEDHEKRMQRRASRAGASLMSFQSLSQTQTSAPKRRFSQWAQ